ncbi:hypothetical protein Peur_048774 [Populus x canadensis]
MRMLDEGIMHMKPHGRIAAKPSYLSPFTASTVAINSSSSISSGDSLTDKAPTFWLKFSILVVSGIGQTSSPWWCTQVNASCDGVHCFLAAI